MDQINYNLYLNVSGIIKFLKKIKAIKQLLLSATLQTHSLTLKSF